MINKPTEPYFVTSSKRAAPATPPDRGREKPNDAAGDAYGWNPRLKEWTKKRNLKKWKTDQNRENR